ncbi:MAG: glycosyltransferase family 9 protein [Patescibacteria group bacterium]
MDNLIALECRFVRQEIHKKRRVLIFRKDVLGDFVIFIPTLKYYREYYKDYDISLVVNSVCAELTPLFPFIDDVIIFDQKKFRTNFWHRRAFIKNLAQKGFDVAIYPVYTSEKIGDIIMKDTRAPKVLDFKTIAIPDSLNELDKNMAFVSNVVGKPCEALFPTIDVSLLDKKHYEQIYKEYALESGKYVAVVPGAGATYKMWQLNKMFEIVDYLVEKGLSVVLSGTTEEQLLGEEIMKQSKHRDKVINLIGRTSLPSLAHLLAGAKLYFGNDTGTLHLAVAVGTPSIAIMGGGHFGRFFPYGNLDINRIVFNPNMKCRGDGWKCAEGLSKGEPAPCIKNISVADVKKEIDALLSIVE